MTNWQLSSVSVQQDTREYIARYIIYIFIQTFIVSVTYLINDQIHTLLETAFYFMKNSNLSNRETNKSPWFLLSINYVCYEMYLHVMIISLTFVNIVFLTQAFYLISSPSSPMQTDADPCSPNPCKHDSSCFNIQGDFYCHCQEGWEGKDCSQPRHMCGAHSCEGRVVCPSMRDTVIEILIAHWRCAHKDG